nr:retrovirus-related Pol polyprotein from transposon TNT 1-94 [Tanacetum cinerariifolium]
VWKLVPLPDGKIAIETKWILKNKKDARGIVVRNKAKLVAQGHRQEDGIDYDEPSCGSDVKVGNKESMCIDSSVKTSCATDINENNVHNDSTDFDHDPNAKKGLGDCLIRDKMSCCFVDGVTYGVPWFCESVKKVEELKKHLQIVPNDNDVYTEATPLAFKVPVVDYEIHSENNKPYYKIIRADGSHQLFLIFLSLLRNFDREDLEMLWQIVQERFASSKPKNFFDDFLLTTLTYMFEKPDVEAQVWKNQRDDLAGREKISIDKVYFRADAEQCKVRS